MKKRLFTFLALAVAALLCGPLYNILASSDYTPEKAYEKSFLYNTDFFSSLAAQLLYPLGISTAPSKVVVGKNDWLFLGDLFNKTISTDRSVADNTSFKTANKIMQATLALDALLKEKGIKEYKVIIGPNKGTIYPEHMPAWSRTVSNNATSELIKLNPKSHIDLSKRLLSEKKKGINLYYKTDTHWNNLGGAIAFDEFSRIISQKNTEIIWPQPINAGNYIEKSRRGGDLGRLSKTHEKLRDKETIIDNLPHIKTEEYSFNDMRIVYQGPNRGIPSKDTPYLIKSPDALNKKKVLWLRDSFGNALSKQMAVTFSEVVQIHWRYAYNQQYDLLKLVDKFKPDYVFVTVVERDARSPGFMITPPILVSDNNASSQTVSRTILRSQNHLTSTTSPNSYQIAGIDPYLNFALEQKDDSDLSHKIKVTLSCSDGTPAVPVQLFWIAQGDAGYNQERSARLNLPAHSVLISHNTIAGWPQKKLIKNLRIDIDAKHECQNFSLAPPEFVK
jgi:alginate O-acetyltransferase complex protein AlgJ